jgi:hypothetical protein
MHGLPGSAGRLVRAEGGDRVAARPVVRSGECMAHRRFPAHAGSFAFLCDAQGWPVGDVERWTAFWKDRFSKRCGNPAWRWQRGLFHHRLSASVSQTTRHFSCPPLPQPRGLASISKPRCLPRSRKARRVASRAPADHPAGWPACNAMRSIAGWWSPRACGCGARC